MNSSLAFIIKTVLDWLLSKLNGWLSRKKEQKERHGEVDEKTDEYKKSGSADSFSKLP